MCNSTFKSSGVTLVELLVGLAIVSFLVFIAVPTYQRHIIKTHRETAKAALSDMLSQIVQQRARSSNANLFQVIDPQTLLLTPVPRYQFQLTPNPIGNTVVYWLTAIPQDRVQLGDGALTLSSDGQGCWHRHNDRPAAHECLTGSEVW